MPFHKECPPKLQFNSKLEKCDWPWKTNCVRQQNQHGSLHVGISQSRETLCDDRGGPGCTPNSADPNIDSKHAILAETASKASLEDLEANVDESFNEIVEKVITETISEITDHLAISVGNILSNQTISNNTEGTLVK